MASCGNTEKDNDAKVKEFANNKTTLLSKLESKLDALKTEPEFYRSQNKLLSDKEDEINAKIENKSLKIEDILAFNAFKDQFEKTIDAKLQELLSAAKKDLRNAQKELNDLKENGVVKPGTETPGTGTSTGTIDNQGGQPTTNPFDKNELEKNDLKLKENEIESLKDRIEFIEQKLIKRSSSTKYAINKLSKFLQKFLEAAKTSQPELYQSNQTIIDNTIDKIEKSIEEVKTVEETYENRNFLRQRLRFLIDNIGIILAEYLHELRNADINYPAEKFMDELAQWRIKDLELIVSNWDANGAPEKQENLQAVKDTIKLYQTVLSTNTENQTLYNQVKTFYSIELNVWYRAIQNPFTFGDFDYNKLAIPQTMKVSEYPLSAKINDQNVFDQLSVAAQKVIAKFQTLYTTKAKDYLNSVAYGKLYAKYIYLLVKLTKFQFTTSNVTVNDFLYSFQEIEKELAEFDKDTTNELTGYQNEIASMLNFSGRTGTVYDKFRTTIDAKYRELNVEFEGDESASAEFREYKKARTYVFGQLSEINRMPEDTVVRAVDKLIALKRIDSIITTLDNLFTYYKLLSIDLNDETTRTTYGISNISTRFTRQIEQEEALINEYNTVIRAGLNQDMAALKTLDTNAKSDLATSKSYATETVVPKLTELVNKYTTELTSEEGKYHYETSEFRDTLDGQINTILRALLGTFTTLNADENATKEQYDQAYAKLKTDITSLQKFYGKAPVEGEEPYDGTTLWDGFKNAFANAETDGRQDLLARKDTVKALVEEFANLFPTLMHEENFTDAAVAKQWFTDTYAKYQEIYNKISQANDENGVWYGLSSIDYDYFRDLPMDLLNDRAFRKFLKKGANEEHTLEDLNFYLSLINTFVKSKLSALGDEDTYQNNLNALIDKNISDSNDHINGFRRRIRKLEKEYAIVPGQEIFAAIRQFEISKGKELNELMDAALISDSMEDKYVFGLTSEFIKQLRSSNRVYRAVTDNLQNNIEATNADGEDDVVRQKELYTQFLGLEKSFNDANLAYLNAKKSNNSDNLETLKSTFESARDAYYNFLNSRDGYVIVSNGFMKFSPSIFNNDSENGDVFTSFDLAKLYAEQKATLDIVEYIKNTLMANK
ncbi:hypothetical protein H9M94_00885 [Mycoplasma sp. Pen4]|uniref:hypothetical protein n=1 Tax=Mycoplasma sp. Pen4 TaxID=640330 RepID=UPI001654062E|nr:hypothetical protein [Mycoplasma sp. Pen4]QNM93815.1 hypothetical protein H9M94_00885 [Mycoplasma sp. Pen4]